jgi:uracil-DNA glycosylase
MHAPEPISPDALAAVLEFYRNIGVDLAIGDAPRDRFAEAEAEKARASEPAPALSRAAPPAPLRQPPEPRASRETPPLPQAARPLNPALAADAAQVAASAAEQAAAAQTLDELRERLAAFEGCALKTTATQLVFEDGVRDARIMLVGEAPGAEEDRTGKPFVGRAGQLLDRMLAAIGLDRTNVYIANVVPWRPPGNRTPSPLEVAACLPFIRRQIELIGPDVLVCLGAPSMQALLDIKEGILKSRGRWTRFSLGERDIPAMAVLHPAYLLRQPLQKRLAWRDLRAIRRVLDGQSPE